MNGQAATARRQARAAADVLRTAAPEALKMRGVDLLPAVEQQLFFALRDGSAGERDTSPRLVGGLTEAAIALLAGGAALQSWRLPSPGPRPMVVLVRDPTHYPVLAQIEAELQAAAGEALAIVRTGRAARARPHAAIAPRLVEFVSPAWSTTAAAAGRRLRRAVELAGTTWVGTVGTQQAGELTRVVARRAQRITLGAAALLAVIHRWRPSLLVAFDEIGTWARLLPAVARTSGIPSLDLPHAEAADAPAISGAAYDRMASYGPAASAVLRRAGIPEERIVEIGAPRFDPLVRLVRDAGPAASAAPCVVFAAQYHTGAMRPGVLRACYEAAVAAAEALAAAELVVVPHPAEAPGTAAQLMAASRPAAPVRLAAPGTLHAEIARAALLVTGWSNAVFEAAVAGVPAITVDPGGVAPVDFGAAGLSIGVADAAGAADAARLLRAAATRDATVARARQVASQRLGPLDGRASARAAKLMLSMAGRGSAGAAA